MALVDRGEDIKAEYRRRFKLWPSMMSALSEKSIMQVTDLANPVDGRFAYPFEKRRTKQNVQALQQAERNLDQVWVGIDRLVYGKCGSLGNTALRRVLSQPRIMQRTADWVDPPPSVAKQSERESILDPDLVSLYKPLSTIYIGTSSTDGHDPHAPASKSKSKKKNAANHTLAPPVAMATKQLPEAEPNLDPILVDARSFKVFRTLFFNPTVTSSPGEISWNDFLHAMTSTGLFAAEKLYGSVWQFQKLVGGDQSRIQFHEPHPRGKIPFTTARRHGRRLNRAFGRNRDMFVLKGK